MKKNIMFLFALTFICQIVKSEFPNQRFITIDRVLRCENNEVVCYLFLDNSGYGGRGGMSCKFKESKNESKD